MSVRSIRALLFVAVIATAVSCAGAVLAEYIRRERVSFKAGTSSATMQGSITGEEGVDYVLGARAGQTMTVAMKTDNGANYFNVLLPGSIAAIAIGATIGNEWTGTLPADGDYTIRVYLMRSAARRNEKASYTLSVGITGRADAKVAGTPYDAAGTVPCSVGTDPKGSVECSFGVIRRDPGNAEVHLQSPGYDVKLHKDGVRVLKFAGEKVTSANAAEKVTAEKRGDTWMIGVDDFYFYVIPEAVIVGG